MKKKSHLYLILSLCLAAACSIGMYMNSFGVFFSPIAQSLNQKRGDVALFYTIMALAAAVASIFVSNIATNKNYKKIYIGGIVLSICSLVLMANASGLMMLYVGGLLLGAGFSPFFMVMLTTVINCSIDENVGTITGIVFSFSGIAGALFSPLYAAVIEKSGWHFAFYMMAGCTLILCLPGLFADMKVERQQAQSAESITFNYFQISYILIVIMAVCFMFVPALPQHFPGLASSRGLDPEIGPLLVSAAMIGNIVFKLIAGVLVDKLGSLKAMAIMTTINLSGSVLLLITRGKLISMIAAFLFGAIYSVTAVLMATLVREMFGTDSYKKAFSVMTLAGNTCNAIAISAIGYVYDFFASYDPALILAMVLCVAALMLAFTAGKKQPKQSL